MSKNYPHDNIYSIIGKLDALKPTPEEQRFALVKEIQATVEAQGSILEGVDAVEQQLMEKYMGFDKTVAAIKKGGHAENPEAVAAAIGRKKYGKAKFQKAAAAGKKLGEDEVDEKAPPGEKAERMVKHIKAGYAKDGKLTDKEKAIAYATTWAAHNKGQVEEAGAVCSECGMVEGECEHTMDEGTIEPTSKGVRHHASPGVYGGYDPETDPDKDEEPKASAEKKGRGRPKKAAADRSQASLPWGGKPPKDTYKHQKGSFVHKISESRMMDESGETIEHILNRFRHEVRNFEQGGDLDQDLYDALFDYYLESGEMPYGTAKARTGDPYEWVAQNLESHLRGGGIIGGNDFDADYEMEREAIGDPQPGIPGNIPVPGKMDRLNNPRDYYEDTTMENELNELAKLAGLSVGEGVDKAKFAALAEPKDKITYADKIAGATKTDEEVADEGNEFGKKIRDAKADGIQPGEKIEIDGREVPVKECGVEASPEITLDVNDLLQILRIAGLGNGEKAQAMMAQPVEVEVDEADVEVDEPLEPVNDPKPEYKSMRQSTMNPGEGDFGEKAMHPDRPTKNNGDNALAKPAMEDVFALESKLAAEYESIKKITK